MRAGQDDEKLASCHCHASPTSLPSVLRRSPVVGAAGRPPAEYGSVRAPGGGQLVMSLVAKRRAASRPNTAAYSTAESTPPAMFVQSTSVAISSIHAKEKCVGR